MHDKKIFTGPLPGNHFHHPLHGGSRAFLHTHAQQQQLVSGPFRLQAKTGLLRLLEQYPVFLN